MGYKWKKHGIGKIAIDIDVDLKQQFKSKLIREGKTMKEVIQDFIESYLNDEKKQIVTRS